MLKVSNRISIPDSEIEFKAVTSQGAGGQHVNKASTAIQLFFDIRASSSLPEEVKERLLSRSDHRITEGGLVVIKSQESRSQEANREAALQRLKQLLRSALSTPKKRKPTRPSRASKERRLKSKAKRARVKQLRKGADPE